MENTTSPDTSLNSEVKRCKDRLLKERLKTLIKSKGLSEADFYNDLGISRQYWFFISWGLWDCPIEIKVRISKALEIDTSLIWQEKKDDDGKTNC